MDIAGQGGAREASRGRRLCVAEDARWFCWSSAARVDLARRKALQQVLAALVEQRERAPGEPVANSELIARGWPGETMRYESARNRLYVAVNALRELGLRSAIEKRSTGYLIAPSLPIDRG